MPTRWRGYRPKETERRNLDLLLDRIGDDVPETRDLIDTLIDRETLADVLLEAFADWSAAGCARL